MNFTYTPPSLPTFSADLKRAIAHARKEQVHYVYNTAALEGNPMTFPEVQTLLQGITVGGHKVSDAQQVLNQNKSWNHLLELVAAGRFAVDKATICVLHADVAREEALEWGVFRTQAVTIGGSTFAPPAPAQLDVIFTQGLAELAAIESSILRAFVYFLFGSINQFFFDGNKRTSRLVMNGILLSAGLPILNILAKDRLAFNTQMLAFYDSQDATAVLKWLVEYYEQQNLGCFGIPNHHNSSPTTTGT